MRGKRSRVEQMMLATGSLPSPRSRAVARPGFVHAVPALAALAAACTFPLADPPHDGARPRDLAIASDLAVPHDLALPPAPSDGGGDAAPPCVGATPPPGAWNAKPGPTIPDAGSPCPTTCPGSPAPTWTLTDFQPKSCGFRATYGLDVFRGKAVLLALWAGW